MKSSPSLLLAFGLLACSTLPKNATLIDQVRPECELIAMNGAEGWKGLQCDFQNLSTVDRTVMFTVKLPEDSNLSLPTEKEVEDLKASLQTNSSGDAANGGFGIGPQAVILQAVMALTFSSANANFDGKKLSFQPNFPLQVRQSKTITLPLKVVDKTKPLPKSIILEFTKPEARSKTLSL